MRLIVKEVTPEPLLLEIPDNIKVSDSRDTIQFKDGSTDHGWINMTTGIVVIDERFVSEPTPPVTQPAQPTPPKPLTPPAPPTTA